MPAPRLVILADDLTGAADTSAGFARAGLVTVLPLCGDASPPADVLSLSSECRDIDECDVPAQVRATLRQALLNGRPDRWYKKIDSGLRGHPGLELAMIMESQGIDTAVIAPALPSEGRVTIEGRVYVHGLPLHTTTLGSGSSTSFVIERLRGHTDANIVWIGLDSVRRGAEALAETITATGHGMIVIDATSDEDLLTIAEAATHLPHMLLSGSAGFATALSDVLPLRSHAPKPPSPVVQDKPVLIVAGTRHEATTRQISYAHEAGMAVVRPDDIESLRDQGQIASLRRQVTRFLASGIDTILTITGCAHSSIPGHQLAERLAEVASGPCLDGMAGGLVLTGGDVAAAVCDHLDVDVLYLQGEVLPAIPWATLGSGPLARLPIVTKAGSFGGVATFTSCVQFLRGLAHRENSSG